MLTRARWSRRAVGLAAGILASVVLGLVSLGCGGWPGGEPGGGEGQGPGHRAQYLALTPQQELSLGRQAYAEVLSKYRDRIVHSGADAAAVKEVGQSIVKAALIKPLQREINLHFDERYMEWEFTLIDDRQVNAFCLPGGKVAVFTGLFSVLRRDQMKDELAAVMGHEIGHALAHHASERVYRERQLNQAVDAADRDALSKLSPAERKEIMSSLAPGTTLGGLAFDRAQESEADHIGLFLMTFAGFKPEACIRLWQDMAQRHGGSVPEILSDHPSDARRIAQMEQWVPQAKAALKAYEAGQVAK
jgi:predicted Zn-dependent protease